LVNDYSAGNIKSKNASITSQQLIVTDSGGKETAYDLPEDEFLYQLLLTSMKHILDPIIA
jgi:hypothetical protein